MITTPQPSHVPRPALRWVSLLARVLLLAAAAGYSPDAGAIEVQTRREDGRVDVLIDGKLFTSYLYKGRTKPVLYPVHGPDQVPMTRNFPLRDGVEGEAKDHPHHESLWYTHGNVNGENFWLLGKAKIEALGDPLVVTVTHDKVATATLNARNRWLAADGKPVLVDHTVITCTQEADGTRTLDYDVTLTAPFGELTFADDKEGVMGIRTHPALQLKADKSTPQANGQAINSEGDKGKDVWGKRAQWVAYWARVPKENGPVYGVAIFDHPSNPRHPTYWHARDYGLIAANPFGVAHFTNQQKTQPKLGEFKVPAGGRARFAYRFVFFKGDPEQATVKARYEKWAATSLPTHALDPQDQPRSL
jgi:hypothetical protein